MSTGAWFISATSKNLAYSPAKLWLVFQAIYWKDMLHSFRDKDVFIYTFVVPTLLYPVLLLGSAEIMMLKADADKDKTIKYAVAADSKNDAGINHIDEILQKRKHFVKVNSTNVEQDLDSGKIDGVLSRHHGEGSYVEIKVNKLAKMASLDDEVNAETSKAYNDDLSKTLTAKGLAPENLQGFSVESRNLVSERSNNQKRSPDKHAGLQLRKASKNLENISATFVLLIFSLLMLGLGAAYPAIAVTAEEFERNTIETSCLLPVSRSLLMLGKLFSVSTFALLSGVINFVSLYAVAHMVLSQTKLFASMGSEPLQISVNATQVGGLIAGYMLVGLLISSLLILATSFCRTVRSAQQWTTFPLFIILILPPCALSPSLELNGYTMWIPLINCSLMLKAIFNGTVFSVNFLVVLLVTVLTCLMSLGLARLFLFEQIDPGIYFARLWDKLMSTMRTESKTP